MILKQRFQRYVLKNTKNLKLTNNMLSNVKNVQIILNVLDTLLRWVNEIPPVENSKSRFGNPAFRTFYEKVKNVSRRDVFKSIANRFLQSIPELFKDFVSEPAIKEVGKYFYESFGNEKRIDYGTGHEANFMAWL